MSCKCRLTTHTIGKQTTGGGVGFTLIEPFLKIITCHYNKTWIDIRVQWPSINIIVFGTTAVITIRTRNCPEAVMETLAPFQRRVIQVEDFESLTMTATGEVSANIKFNA
ncbi:hypothetical protein [Fictibacillus sp. NRS-1165]|uniref:hypothetical protein n=1 Tax=Fictibacillus sp. NRS-1165 TaxID=3144463 RepID=UPI003D21B2AE